MLDTYEKKLNRIFLGTVCTEPSWNGL